MVSISRKVALAVTLCERRKWESACTLLCLFADRKIFLQLTCLVRRLLLSVTENV